MATEEQEEGTCLVRAYRRLADISRQTYRRLTDICLAICCCCGVLCWSACESSESWEVPSWCIDISSSCWGWLTCYCCKERNDVLDLSNKRTVLRQINLYNEPLVLARTSKKLQNDRRVVLAACTINGMALQYASRRLKNDMEVVSAACSQDAFALQYASQEMQHNKDVILKACSQNGTYIVHAPDDLQTDKEFLLEACPRNWRTLESAPQELQNHKQFVLAACSHYGWALKYASEDLQNDKEVVLMACSQEAIALKFASQQLRNDDEVVLTACSLRGDALSYATKELQNDKEVVMKVCSKFGSALKYASETLRANKEVVMAAVESNPESLKFALGGLNQDKDCLIKAKLLDESYDADRKPISRRTSRRKSLTPIIEMVHSLPAESNKRKIVLSTKFSLGANCSPHATHFTLELKKHPYIADGKFLVYSPNAFNKGTCDPRWTNKNWSCRGTYSSCRKPHHLKTGVPQEAECCWRYSFRYQLGKAAASGGFMLQVVDWNSNEAKHALGDGQAIETEMAEAEGVKVFRFFEPLYSYEKQVDQLVSKIQEWYEDGCSDLETCNVLKGFPE